MKFTPFDRGVRFDVYLADNKGTVYDIEMQTTPQQNVGKRIRYYQGMIDLDSVETGGRFTELRKSFIIFICKNKPVGFIKNLPIYTFMNKCMEDNSVELGDDTTKVIINASAPIDNISIKLKNLLKFIKTNKPVDNFTKRIQTEVEEAKISKKWRTDYMTLEMKLQESFDSGYDTGYDTGISNVVKQMLDAGMPIKDIIKYTKIKKSDVLRIQQEVSSND